MRYKLKGEQNNGGGKGDDQTSGGGSSGGGGGDESGSNSGRDWGTKGEPDKRSNPPANKAKKK